MPNEWEIQWTLLRKRFYQVLQKTLYPTPSPSLHSLILLHFPSNSSSSVRGLRGWNSKEQDYWQGPESPSLLSNKAGIVLQNWALSMAAFSADFYKVLLLREMAKCYSCYSESWTLNHSWFPPRITSGLSGSWHARLGWRPGISLSRPRQGSLCLPQCTGEKDLVAQFSDGQRRLSSVGAWGKEVHSAPLPPRTRHQSGTTAKSTWNWEVRQRWRSSNSATIPGIIVASLNFQMQNLLSNTKFESELALTASQTSHG